MMLRGTSYRKVDIKTGINKALGGRCKTQNKIIMSKTIKTKFNVAEITQYGNGGGSKVTMLPVIGGSVENKAFWEATPAGKIEIITSNPDPVFEFGEYYVDFTKAE